MSFFNVFRAVVIAEAGINHDGSLDEAKRLVDVAADAHSDYVKFQSFHPETIVLPEAERSSYIVEGSYPNESFRDLLARLHLDWDAQRELHRYCVSRGMKFLSTPFDEDNLDFLCDELDVDFIKIASGDLTNTPLLRSATKKGKPILLSTGMADLIEIADAVDILKSANVDFCLMHCVSWYPCEFDICNLNVINTLKKRFNCIVGFSDHSLGVLLPPVAVAMGARVIEKHFTLDTTAFGPDHKASLSPADLIEVVANIRKVEIALGTGEKALESIDPLELGQRKVHRRSIVTLSDIAEGEAFTLENLGVKRPGTGMKPSELEALVGKKSSRSLNKDVLLRPADVVNEN